MNTKNKYFGQSYQGLGISQALCLSTSDNKFMTTYLITFLELLSRNRIDTCTSQDINDM